MNPYSVIVATVAGRQRKCKACGATQIIKCPREGYYHCKKCGHRFTRAELLHSTRKSVSELFGAAKGTKWRENYRDRNDRY